MFLLFFSVTTWTSGQRGHASMERLGHKFSRLGYWAEPGFQAPLKSYPKNFFSRGRTSEAAILVSHPFAFVFSWYKVIIALSFFFSTGALQHTAHTSIIAAKIVSLKIRAPTEQQYRSGQHKMQTADRVQNADCRLVIKCHFTSYWASRNRFSAIIHCGIFWSQSFLIQFQAFI